MIILKRILHNCEDVNWVQLAQDIGQWWVLQGMEINNQVPLKQRNFLVS
jgi:hypothetical protein